MEQMNLDYLIKLNQAATNRQSLLRDSQKVI